MPTTTTRPREIDRLESATSQMAHLLGRTRRHDEIRLSSGVALDRAAIVVLRALDESGPIRPADLAELLLLDRPHISRQIQVLEREGLVSVTADPKDARARRVATTPAGRLAADQLRGASRDAMARALHDWSAEDLSRLGELLSELVVAFRVDLAEQSEEKENP
jgi:DNA-binding MarR family transcriptional regulator